MILRDYFSTNKTSNYSRDIEVILKQLPIIHYDGNNISINEETPLYLYNSSNNKVAAIDTKNQLPMSERLKIPIIFTNNINFADIVMKEGSGYNNTNSILNNNSKL